MKNNKPTHINGRYLIVVALIGAFASFTSVFINNYLESNEQPAQANEPLNKEQTKSDIYKYDNNDLLKKEDTVKVSPSISINKLDSKKIELKKDSNRISTISNDQFDIVKISNLPKGTIFKFKENIILEANSFQKEYGRFLLNYSPVNKRRVIPMGSELVLKNIRNGKAYSPYLIKRTCLKDLLKGKLKNEQNDELMNSLSLQYIVFDKSHKFECIGDSISTLIFNFEDKPSLFFSIIEANFRAKISNNSYEEYYKYENIEINLLDLYFELTVPPLLEF